MSRSQRLSLRSSQRSTPRKKYTVDAFAGIEGLQSSDESGGDAGPNEQEDDDDDVDGDEEGEAAWQASAESEPDDDDDDAMSGVEDLAGLGEVHEDDAPSDAGERDLDDNISIAEEPTELQFTSLPRKRKKKVALPKAEQTYQRGQLDNFELGGRSVSAAVRRHLYFGPDLETAVQARNRWGYDVGFPSRKQKKAGTGGFAHSAAFDKDIQNADANWAWYTHGGGKEAFKRRQITRTVRDEEVAGYISLERSEHCVVVGPAGQQKLFHLQAGEHMNINGPFEKQVPPGQQWREALPAGYKTGFILNLGARIQGLDWAPNCSKAQQYLAVSILPHRQEGNPEQKSSFVPQPKYPSSIQIWELSATETTGHIENARPPKLRKAICTTAGDIKALKWCPVPLNDSAMLGLLAFISGDGFVRVIAVGRPNADGDTSYRHMDEFPFEGKPSNTICTCLAWISSTRLAVGCANGCVAVWDLSSALFQAGNPRPLFYGSPSTTYILSIQSGYPTHPDILITSSMDGYITVTDISRPLPFSPCNTALSNRARVGHPAVVWHQFSKSAVSVEDSGTVRLIPLRRWFSTVGVARVKSTMLCMATSPCHPSILIGTAGGDVVSTVPIRRLVDGGRTSLWQQIWFMHEWRRPTEAESTNTDQSETEPSKKVIGNEGLSRFVEGYKAEKLKLTNSHGPENTRSKNGIVFKTVYEEKTAVSALAWNPNLNVGGWAAAGMADGLLRIEDVAA